MINEEKLEMLKEQYIAVAKDINKPINLQMLQQLTKNLGVNVSTQELQQILSEMDEDGNGTIEFDEFVEAMKKKTKESELEMKDAFKVLDRNKNGYISPGDLKHLLLCIGENYSLEEIDQILKEIDEDGDGFINFQEFLKIMNEQ